MTDQQDQIRSRVARMARARNRQRRPVFKAQDIQIPKKEQSSFLGTFLVTCILLLAIATVPVMYYKGQDRKALASEPPQTSQPLDRPSTPDPERYDQNRWNSALAARLTAIENASRAQQHRLWLLVLAHNENANLLKQMDVKHHKVNERGFITFDEDWHFNKLPETMKLTPEQRDQIQNELR